MIRRDIEGFRCLARELQAAPDDGSALTISHIIIDRVPLFVNDVEKFLESLEGDQ